ncbi:MAG: RDD family protein, partial [Verrucomicrobia bacterium]
TYRQAFLRSLGTVVSVAPLGLGFLWIIWSREKRGWHDFLARTWVIRD